jgi:hypothetical protein
VYLNKARVVDAVCEGIAEGTLCKITRSPPVRGGRTHGLVPESRGAVMEDLPMLFREVR